MRGAVGFRQIPDSNIYAIGQPTEDAIDFVLTKVKERTPTATSLLWIKLREEPLTVSRRIVALAMTASRWRRTGGEGQLPKAG